MEMKRRYNTPKNNEAKIFKKKDKNQNYKYIKIMKK